MLKIRKPKVSIIMPVVNEIKTVEDAVRRVHALDIDKEIIVIDDYSTDGSREVLKQLQPELRLKLILHAQNRGKGAGVRNAVAHAKGEFMIVEDADLELDINDALTMLTILENDPKLDMVIGNRILKGNKQVNLVTKLAKFLTSMVTFLLYGRRVKDVLCAYKVCRLHKFKSLNLQSTMFGLESEWLATALKRGWQIKEYDIHYTPRKKEHKKIRFLDGFDIIGQLIKLRFSK